jgi:hypothetical protein
MRGRTSAAGIGAKVDRQEPPVTAIPVASRWRPANEVAALFGAAWSLFSVPQLCYTAVAKGRHP